MVGDHAPGPVRSYSCGVPTPRPCRVLPQRIEQKRLDYSEPLQNLRIPLRFLADWLLLTDSGIPCFREPNGLPGAEQRTCAFPPGDIKASVSLWRGDM